MAVADVASILQARYELKTGRKTPLGYDKWFVWVKERGLLVDEYDQVGRRPSSLPRTLRSSER